jgi:hypothetical protein
MIMKANFILAIFISLMLSLTAGQPATPGKGAGPRLGAIVRVEIAIQSRADLESLTEAGYDVAGVNGNRVLLYADADELAVLRAANWNLKILPTAPVPQILGEYNNYSNMTATLDDYATNFPSVCRKTSLGKSVQGRELWAMKITSNPDLKQDKPEVKFVFAIHGNEYEATEVSLFFIDSLLKGYATNDARIVNLVNNLEIWIVPLMNPDGREMRPASRYNARGYDLNRSFPTRQSILLSSRLYGASLATNVPPEVLHIMSWTESHNFSLAANLHTGVRLVCYPYGDGDGIGNVNTPTPDDAVVRSLALTYATNNPQIHTNSDPHYPNGVVNASEWFVAAGCIDDWGYRYDGCLDMCMELTPSFSDAPIFTPAALWSQNRESLLAYAEMALKGVQGVIRDARTGTPVYGAIRVEGIHHTTFSDREVGDFHRILLPGTYNLWFYAPGYTPQTISGVVVRAGNATRLDVSLQPVNSRFAAKINFQPGLASLTVPPRYLADSGAAFGDRGNGFTYGWDAALNAVVRRASRSQDVRYDSFCQMQAGSSHYWEIAVPNGPYSVLIAAGDPLTQKNRYQIRAEGNSLLDAAVAATNASDCNRWAEALGTVIVTDGRLTISNGPDATNNLLDFVEISALEPQTIAQWRARYFGTTNDTSDAATAADPDNDGLPNLLEYALGLDPMQPDGRAQLTPSVVRNGDADYFGCEFLRNANATDVTIRVESSDDLTTGDWLQVVTYTSGSGWSGPGSVLDAPANAGRTKVTVIPAKPIKSGQNGFLRLAVSCP